MDIQTILDIGITIDITIFVFSSVGLIVLVCVYLAKHASKTRKIHKTKQVHVRPTYYPQPTNQNAKNEIFPNGYSRQDYYDYGADDTAIDYFGLDQPGAPEPGIAGIVLMDFFK